MRALLAVIAVVFSFPALADSKAGEKKAQLCLLFHKPGPVGAPLLEAQPAKYLVAQIAAFKAGKRTDAGMRPKSVERWYAAGHTCALYRLHR